jgi:putative glutamine amidotransferase
VNSSHHQSPKGVGPGWRITATAPDGVIEGLELPGDRFVVGVQWHPELMETRADQRRLFAALVEAAAVHAAGSIR